ncbi:hypothetical protein PMI09_04419 [Rhizobium sp. CF122]|uniref:DUF2293 domain-containing protein n=1 Tax=Rhizobium sp. CF122 TaxID=1144312 RepID=UPI000271A984|nr:DUF2293 domain-containing protein [Rhizobium sp. CF122]EJL51629.1 hypothetical protein PMI09_04419 [Rhizobium sp. CF122]
MPKYTVDKVSDHIRKHHPRCPEFAVNFFAAEVAKKKWRGASIGKAVGITMQNYLRHNMTRYEGLLLAGVSREDARRLVKPKIDRMIRSWR